jgi:hypothetical protein
MCDKHNSLSHETLPVASRMEKEKEKEGVPRDDPG